MLAHVGSIVLGLNDALVEFTGALAGFTFALGDTRVVALAGSITKRFEAFNIPVDELDSSDVLDIYALAGKAIAGVRTELRPRALLLHTCRFGPHSKGDDTRSVKEVERLRIERDPLRLHGARLKHAERLSNEGDVNAEVAAAFELALQDPFPPLE